MSVLSRKVSPTTPADTKYTEKQIFQRLDRHYALPRRLIAASGWNLLNFIVLLLNQLFCESLTDRNICPMHVRMVNPRNKKRYFSYLYSRQYGPCRWITFTSNNHTSLDPTSLSHSPQSLSTSETYSNQWEWHVYIQWECRALFYRYVLLCPRSGNSGMTRLWRPSFGTYLKSHGSLTFYRGNAYSLNNSKIWKGINAGYANNVFFKVYVS